MSTSIPLLLQLESFPPECYRPHVHVKLNISHPASNYMMSTDFAITLECTILPFPAFMITTDDVHAATSRTIPSAPLYPLLDILRQGTGITVSASFASLASDSDMEGMYKIDPRRIQARIAQGNSMLQDTSETSSLTQEERTRHHDEPSAYVGQDGAELILEDVRRVLKGRPLASHSIISLNVLRHTAR